MTMKNFRLLSMLGLLSLSVLFMGCPPDDDDDSSVTDDDDAMDDDDAADDDDSSAGDDDDSAGDDDDSAGGDEYVFTDFGDLSGTVQMDRAGMPAVSTALILAENKDAYNAASPADDAASTFVPDIIASLGVLHGALDDDLAGLSLTPCTVVGDGSGTCVGQGAPLIVPDVLSIDTTTPAGFPNGRRLSDQAMDITLAVVLLDLATHGADTFAGLPLNPAANDVDFQATFPYVAAAH